MNVYDFDGTIYSGDSTVDFFLYALKNKPSLLKYIPKQIAGFVLYGLRRINKTQLKEYFFCFLSAIDTEKLSESFWDEKQNKVYSWYLTQQESEDIIISASPEFLLKPICNRLGMNYLIASKVNPRSGKFDGENCRGQAKVHRLEAECGVVSIDKFYSDSKSDLPLARISKSAFLVARGKITEWNL